MKQKISWFISLCAVMILVWSSGTASANDIRGLWNVKVGGYLSTWMIAVEGNLIEGASQWSCCPGFRVDKLSGIINGDRVTIIRHILGQGYPESGIQTYQGNIRDRKVSGTWAGLGGGGNWEADIVH